MNYSQQYYQKNKEMVKQKNLQRFYENHAENLERRKQLYREKHPKQPKIIFHGKSHITF